MREDVCERIVHRRAAACDDDSIGRDGGGGGGQTRARTPRHHRQVCAAEWAHADGKENERGRGASRLASNERDTNTHTVLLSCAVYFGSVLFVIGCERYSRTYTTGRHGGARSLLQVHAPPNQPRGWRVRQLARRPRRKRWRGGAGCQRSKGSTRGQRRVRTDRGRAVQLTSRARSRAERDAEAARRPARARVKLPQLRQGRAGHGGLEGEGGGRQPAPLPRARCEARPLELREARRSEAGRKPRGGRRRLSQHGGARRRQLLEVGEAGAELPLPPPPLLLLLLAELRGVELGRGGRR